MTAHSTDDADLYHTMGVEKGASDDEIKRAYRKLALQLHPDKNPEADPESFKRITRAYGVLSDADKRRKYDMLGVIDDGTGAGGAGGAGFPGGFPFGMGDPLHDIFGSLFGGVGGPGGPMGAGTFVFMSGDGPNGGGIPRPGRPGGASSMGDIHISLAVSLAELRKGATKKLAFEARESCEACHGTGAIDPVKDVVTCITCGGRGVVLQQIFPPFASEITCPGCQGKKRMIKAMRACMACRGACIASKMRAVEIQLPPAVPHGHELRITGKGHACPEKGVAASDLIVRIEHALPPEHRVDLASGDVAMPLTLDVRDLFCGFDCTVAPYGTPVRVHADTGYINPNTVHRIPGMGIPKHDAKAGAADTRPCGDLVLEFKVTFPDDVPHCTKFHDIFCKVFKRGDAGDVPPPP